MDVTNPKNMIHHHWEVGWLNIGLFETGGVKMTKLETWIESDDYADEDGGDDADEDGNWCNYGWIDANLGELMQILVNLG